MMQQKSIELVAWQSNGSIQSFQLKAGQAVLVGKSSNCGLQLSGHDISDIHCRIGFEGGHLWVQDWLSATGTKVNGQPVNAKMQVGQGSVVEVGRYRIQISKASLEAERREEDGSGEEATNSATNQSSTNPDSESDRCLAAHNVAAHNATEDSENLETVNQLDAENQADLAIDAGGLDAAPMVADEADDRPQEKIQPDENAEHCDQPVGSATDVDLRPSPADTDQFSFLSETDDVYDRETVELLLAEIEDLRSSLAQRDAQHLHTDRGSPPAESSTEADQSETVLQRIQELAEEANRADERVLLLEEMLHAAEDVNRAEVEERTQLEAWVGDIERRVGQREQEHAAELDALRERLNRADEQHHRLQREMQETATSEDSAHKRYAETMESLQQDNRQLQDQLAEAQKELRQLKQKYANKSEESDAALREERAKIAKELAEMSRLKYEYAQKIRDVEESMPRSESADCDARLQSLREHRQHLRQMSEQKKQVTESTLSGRLKRLWNCVE